MNLSIATGKQFPRFVWDIDFGKKSTGGGIDGFRGTNHFALKFAAGELRQFEIGRKAGTNRRRGAFRHVYVDANGIGLRERKEQLRSATISGVDQCSDIDVAARDHTAE